MLAGERVMELILHVVASAGLVWFLAVLWSRDRLPECTDRIPTSAARADRLHH